MPRSNSSPLPEEDLGRGGEAGASMPAGTRGEREEMLRDQVRAPSARGPRRPEPKPPTSSSG
jgi:hypothetical protein